jgi:hypothetical protein
VEALLCGAVAVREGVGVLEMVDAWVASVDLGVLSRAFDLLGAIARFELLCEDVRCTIGFSDLELDL